MSWSALLVGPLLVTVLFVAWLLVQRLWGRAFELSESADALEGRGRCSSCTCSAPCQTPSRQRPSTEVMHER